MALWKCHFLFGPGYTGSRARVADHYRWQKRTQLLPLEEEWLSDEVSPQHQAEQAQDEQRLMEAIRHLKSDQQQVLILKFVGRLSNQSRARGITETHGGSLVREGTGAACPVPAWMM
jgi:hypothetical protein